MSIKFNVIAKTNPRDPSAPKKYYASLKSNGDYNSRQMAKDVAEISTVSSVDSMAVIEALLTAIPKQLANGFIVRLGDFGTFYPTISSEGSDAPEQVTASNVTKKGVRFVPGKEFEKVLRIADLVRVNGVVPQEEPVGSRQKAQEQLKKALVFFQKTQVLFRQTQVQFLKRTAAVEQEAERPLFLYLTQKYRAVVSSLRLTRSISIISYLRLRQKMLNIL